MERGKNAYTEEKWGDTENLERKRQSKTWKWTHKMLAYQKKRWGIRGIMKKELQRDS